MLPQACRAPTNLPGSHLPDKTASGCITLLNRKGRMQRPFLGSSSTPQFTFFSILPDPNRGKGTPWPWRTVQAKCSARIFVFGSLLPSLFSSAIIACKTAAQKLCALSRGEDKEELETGQENFLEGWWHIVRLCPTSPAFSTWSFFYRCVSTPPLGWTLPAYHTSPGCHLNSPPAWPCAALLTYYYF